MSLFHAGVVPALDSNGNPISGATWAFYRSGTLTPTAIYANDDLSTSLGSSETADGAGRFVDMYTNDAVLTRAILKDAVGATIKDIDPINGESNFNITPQQFGAVGDDTADDTAAVQAFVNYLATNHVFGHAPMGTYKLTAKINFPATYGWGIIGVGSDATIWKQYTDNIPCFDLGASAVDSMHGYLLTDMAFTYANNQPAANTNAVPIHYSEMGFQGTLQRIRFNRGSYGIKVAAGVIPPWGEHWDGLRFGSGLTGGAIDWTGSGAGGIPNNQWGRFFVDAPNMAGPIFNGIRGYNWTIGTIEILQAFNAQMIAFGAGTIVEIGSLKSELNTYDTAPPSTHLIDAGVNSSVRLGSFDLGGTFCILTPSAALNLFGGAAGTSWEIGSVGVSPSEAHSNFYLLGGSAEYLVKKYTNNNTAFGRPPLTNNGAAATANKVTLLPDKNDRLSDDKGDANYTIVQGDPGTIVHETLFTAPRTDALPVDAALLFNGLRYRFISNGAVNGANTLTIAASGNTKAIIRGPYGFVDMEWRRNVTPHSGWQVVGSGSIRPSALAVVPTANLPAAAAAMDGTVLVEDAGAGDRNLIVYAGGQRFRIDGGAPV